MIRAVSTDRLCKNFNGTVAADNISFYVNRGEIFGFLGPNGAGKTTALRMLTGLLMPDSGTALIDGLDIFRYPIEAKMRMGVIPETSNVYADLTALENIILAGRFYGIRKNKLREKARSLLNRMGLYDKKDTEVRHFSKGMKQKVSVACALVNDATVLFLDEPAAGLDVKSRRIIREVILEAGNSGTAVFLTSHDIQEASLTCERVAVINRGKIAAIDTPENLRRIFEETRSVEVSFDRIVEEKRIKDLAGTEDVRKLGDKIRIYTPDPDRTVRALAGFSQKNNLAFTSLQILGSSLEDAFLKIIRDDPDES